MTAFRRLFPVVLVIIVFAFAVEAQTPCSRYSKAASGFSICPPEGWTRSDESGEKYPKFFAAVPNDGKANLNFQLADSKLSLADYVTAANKYTLEHVKEIGFDSLTLISRTEFVTSSKEYGFRLIYSGSARGMSIRSNQFVFDLNQSQKIILTFTSLESYQAVNDSFFDAVAATFQLEK
jgi:hypothetical protein